MCTFIRTNPYKIFLVMSGADRDFSCESNTKFESEFFSKSENSNIMFSIHHLVTRNSRFASAPGLVKLKGNQHVKKINENQRYGNVCKNSENSNNLYYLSGNPELLDLLYLPFVSAVCGRFELSAETALKPKSSVHFDNSNFRESSETKRNDNDWSSTCQIFKKKVR